MILLGLQEEQEREQPLQVPFCVSTNPLWHVMQVVGEEQLKHFLLQLEQVLLMKDWPGGQEVQLVAVPKHVMH